MTIRGGRREGGERYEDAVRCGITVTTQLQTSGFGTDAIHGKANLCKARQPNPLLCNAWQRQEIQRNANHNKCKQLGATQTDAIQCNANHSIAKQFNAARRKAKQRKATQYKTMGHTQTKTNAKHGPAMQSNAKQCSAMQYNVMQNKATQRNRCIALSCHDSTRDVASCDVKFCAVRAPHVKCTQ